MARSGPRRRVARSTRWRSPRELWPHCAHTRRGGPAVSGTACSASPVRVVTCPAVARARPVGVGAGRCWAGAPRWHDLRHSRGHTLARAGAPIQVIQAILRHQNVNTTRLYMSEVPLSEQERWMPGRRRRWRPAAPTRRRLRLKVSPPSVPRRLRTAAARRRASASKVRRRAAKGVAGKRARYRASSWSPTAASMHSTSGRPPTPRRRSPPTPTSATPRSRTSPSRRGSRSRCGRPLSCHRYRAPVSDRVTRARVFWSDLLSRR